MAGKLSKRPRKREKFLQAEGVEKRGLETIPAKIQTRRQTNSPTTEMGISFSSSSASSNTTYDNLLMISSAQMSLQARPKPATSMLLRKSEIPYRLYRADTDQGSHPSPGTAGFFANDTSLGFPKNTLRLCDLVLNHLRQERGEQTLYDSPFISLWSKKRELEDEIVCYRRKEKGESQRGLTRPGGPGDRWIEEGHGKPWRVWAVSGSKIKGVLRVRDVLGWDEEDGDGDGAEQFLVWKHVAPEAVYVVNGGGYDDIRGRRVEEIKQMESEKSESETERESSSEDEVEGGASLVQGEHSKGEEDTGGEVLGRGRSRIVGSSEMTESSGNRSEADGSNESEEAGKLDKKWLHLRSHESESDDEAPFDAVLWAKNFWAARNAEIKNKPRGTIICSTR